MNRQRIAERLVTLAEALVSGKGEVPEAFKKQWKKNDKGDGKKDDKKKDSKPPWLKKKESSEAVARELLSVARGLTGAPKSPFERALEKAIASKIKELKRDGTLSMGLDNMMQVVRPPSSSLKGAPRGTNARYYYKEMFRDIAKGFRFVTASRRMARELTAEAPKGRLLDLLDDVATAISIHARKQRNRGVLLRLSSPVKELMALIEELD